MSLWSSFRRFSRAKQGEDSGTARFDFRSRSRNLPSLKHRDLRLEQFEQRLLLSVTQDYLDASQLNVVGAWGTATGDGVNIALLDDGIDGNHEYLSPDAGLSWDFMTDSAGGGPVLDTDNHGTAIAGIIASADADPSYPEDDGTTGVAYDANLASYRLTALDPDTSLDNATLAKALGYGLDDIDIYNVGFNYAVELYHPGDEVLGAVRTGVTEGRDGLGSIYTYGAGGTDSNYDALVNSRFTIAVGAAYDSNGDDTIDDLDEPASAPGTATLVSGFAGGNNILTTDRIGTDGYSLGDYTDIDGFGETGYQASQAAAAQISGVIAMMLEANPTLTYRDVQQILVESSSNWDDGDGSYDQDGLGWGTVNAEAAVEAAVTWNHVSPEAVVGSGTLNNFHLNLEGTPYVESSVDIASSIGSVEWVEVTLYGIPGDWYGNQVTLKSPSGEESVLTRKEQATSDGSPLAAGWTFTTAAHWGEASGGKWELNIENTNTGQIGTWGAWDLKVYGQENASSQVGPELVKIIPNAGGELVDGGTLTVAPRELLFQFNENQTLDESTFKDAIDISRVGADPDDETEKIEYTTLPGDSPNQIIVRFAEILTDDDYQIIIKGAGDDALLNEASTPLRFNDGSDLKILFDLDLGAQVVSVVPQPVFRTGLRILPTDTPTDGQTFIIGDGFNEVTFELNLSTSLRPDGSWDLTSDDHVPVIFDVGDSANDIAAELERVLNGDPDPAHPLDPVIDPDFDPDHPDKKLDGDLIDPAAVITALGQKLVQLSGQFVYLDPDTSGFTQSQVKTLQQATDRVDVYFNDDDLNPTAATNPAFYRLLQLNENTGEVDDILVPDKVVYDAEEDKAQLIFLPGVLTEGTYNLKIGTSTESNDALAGAINVGSLWDTATTAVFDGYIDNTDDGNPNDLDLYRFELEDAVGTGTVDVNVALTTGIAWQLNRVDLVNGVETISALIDSGTGSTTQTLPDNNVYCLTISHPDVTANGVDDYDGDYQLTLGVDAVMDDPESNSSYGTATNLGTLGAASTTVTGTIGLNYMNTVDPSTILDQPGGIDEPGHRHIPAEGESHLVSGAGYKTVQNYNFQSYDGWNQITETQKQRAREIFEIYSYYLGIQFVETASDGLTIGTADLRGVMTEIPAGIGGISASLNETPGSTMNSAGDWGLSEYGGKWFTTAMHEIGHNLGLMHAYDIPAIMGAGSGEDDSGVSFNLEAVYPRDTDLVHLNYLVNSVWNEIDLYEFTTTQTGVLTAETVAERLGSTSNLDTRLILYSEVDGVRTVIAQNDDYYSNDSLIELELEPGNYYIGVMSTGLDDVDPTILDSGFGGKSTGDYELELNFAATPQSTIVDATATPLDGDADGVAGGEFDFWFQVDNETVFVDKAFPQDQTSGAPGTITNPYTEIDDAIDHAESNANVDIIRVVGNGGADEDIRTTEDSEPYLVGYDNDKVELEDGALVQLPAGVTMMIDGGAVFKLQDANIEVGSSSQGIDLSHAALQVLGTPLDQVHFRSFRDDEIGGDSDGSSDGQSGGDWGGLVFRADSDHDIADEDPTDPNDDLEAYLNWVGWADIQHGGGKVNVGTIEQNYASIYVEGSRPTVAYSTIQNGSSGAISADLDSFQETGGRIGLDVHGNTVLNNSHNGLFVRIPIPIGGETERLQTAARWDDTDIVHIVAENLFIEGTPGGPTEQDARLRIDPAVIVKLESARIHAEVAGQLIAEGLPGYPVVFTSINDDTYGMSGNFDTSNDGEENPPERGQWSGLVFAPTSHGSLDYVQLSYAGGESPLGGDSDTFNPIEIHQADVRITNSVIELNGGGNSSTTRNGLGANTAAAIFIRGAQPVIVNNTIIDNQGDAISINANALNYDTVTDPGRSTGALSAFTEYVDNHGPLIRENVFDNTDDGGGSQLNGMAVRGELLTAESVWDDTDVVHVLRDEIYIPNLHTFGGLRLQSSQDASLVVKLDGDTAGFTANGEATDIDDRIGGTLQILGTPDYPVILTSLSDDTAAAGFDLDGKPQGNTDEVTQTPNPGDWRSVEINTYANARNVAVVNEVEFAATGQSGLNDTTNKAQLLGQLAPDFDPSLEVERYDVIVQGATDDEKGGDENQRLGFEVHGYISADNPADDKGPDEDVYSFRASAGTEVWIDLDRTSHALDATVELVLFDGTVIASSADDTTFNLDSDYSGVAGDDVGSDVYNDSVTTTFNADGLEQEPYLGHDFYGTNPLDPGMHIVLPGEAGVVGTYYVRVTGRATLNDGTFLTDPVDPTDPTKQVVTSGRYQMQIRLRQVDEFPGCTVRYADIRYATDGIEVYGQPAHSILAAEAGETGNYNGTRSNDQFLGNLLTSDQTAVGVSGTTTSRNDVDWYSVDIDQQGLQGAAGFNDGVKTWSTVFDIDYADGLSRANLTLAVYDSSGRLVFVGRDSNIQDDLPAVGEGSDADDLSRGSFTTVSTGDHRDPFIGPVHVPANSRYYVAVSTNQYAPTELNQAYQLNAANPNVRIEPINSVERIVEDHIGSNGYTTGNALFRTYDVEPVVSNGILPIDDVTALSTHVVPYTLSDVVLYVTNQSTGNGRGLSAINPFTGDEVVYVRGTSQIDDIAMRPDGVLLAERDNSGNLEVINTGLGTAGPSGNDAIPMAYGQPDFGGMAFYDVSTSSNEAWEIFVANNAGYDVLASGDETDGNDQNDNDAPPALWRIVSDGTVVDEDEDTTEYDYVALLPGTGRVTGLEIYGSTIYAVTSTGQLWRGSISGNSTTRTVSWNSIPVTTLDGVNFTGLTKGPQNLDVIECYDGDGDGFPDATADQAADLKDVLFASTSDRLYAIQRNTGALVTVFDNDDDGLSDATSIALPDNSSVTGLAFSPLDVNLWHPTDKRGNDTGHGINAAVDNSRSSENGGTSFYFGLEEWASSPQYHQFVDNSQYGFLSEDNHRYLTSNDVIGDNYNTPGGAYGSLITDDFSLNGYTADDRPTLYFNYYLQTERDQSGPDADFNRMFDSARVWILGYEDTYTQVTSGGDATTRAKAVFSSPGADNDFEISLSHDKYVPGYGDASFNDLPIKFVHDAGSSVEVELVLPPDPAPGLTITYDRGVSTAQQIVDAIQAQIDSLSFVERTVAAPQVQLLETTGAGTVALGFGWQLLTTNNSETTTANQDDGLNELPRFQSPSSDASIHRQQRVQELYDDTSTSDSTVWRQARVDLGDFAGQSGLKLRFDFSTAGEMPDFYFNNPEIDLYRGYDTHIEGTDTVKDTSADEDENDGSFGNFNHADKGNRNAYEGFYIDDIIIGFAERGEMVTGATTNTGTSSLHSSMEWELELKDKLDILSGAYQLEIRRGTEYAQNAHPMVSEIAFTQQFDTNDRLIPEKWATHNYIESAEGFTYVGNYRGDRNVERQQDQLIIENNTIRDTQNIAIRIDAGTREIDVVSGDVIEASQLGSAVNYPVPGVLNEDLVPGVVITNNVVADFGSTGIYFSGDSNEDGDPVTPFGRIVNNTIVGTVDGNSNDGDYGIRVINDASPTILNNIIAETNYGIHITEDSGSTDPRTVYDYNLFQDTNYPVRRNNVNITVGTLDDNLVIPSGDPLFVNAPIYNFYLATLSRAIDSSINAIDDRTAMEIVKEPLIIPLSPIIAPERDRYNQVRVDDDGQNPPSGMGSDIYKDRGAIERADFDGPLSMIVDPYDNTDPRNPLSPKIDGAYDYNNAPKDVVVINQKTTDLAVQFSDAGGIGIDDASILDYPPNSDPVVKTDLVKVYRVSSLDVFDTLDESSWPALQRGDDYLLDYDTVNNILHVLPATGIWESGWYYVIDIDNDMVRDLADNGLEPNRSVDPFTDKTVFTVHLTGLDFGDLPDDPDNDVNPDYVTLLESGPVAGLGGARHVVTGGVFLGSEPDVEADAHTGPAPIDELYQEHNDFQHTANGDLHDDGIVVTAALQMGGVAEITVNASTDGFLNAWIDFNGNGTIDLAEERIFPNEPLTAGINTLTFNVPADTVVNPADPGAADVYQRGARFRFTSESFDDGAYPWLAGGLTDPAAGFTGIAYDGEVEDYMFPVVRYRQDWGDAPADVFAGTLVFPTLHNLGGATHYITPAGPYLGTVPDAEMDGQPTADASGDDLDNNGTGTIAAGTGASPVDTSVTYITSGGSAGVPATIAPFNPEDPNNAFQIFEPNGTNDIEVQFATGGATGALWNTVQQKLEVTFDDGTTTANDLVEMINGAVGNPLVAELVGDSDNDEDGVTFLDDLIPGESDSVVEVNLGSTGLAMLDGWIDFNGNGIWEDEYAETELINPEGMHNEFRFVARDPGQVGTRIAVQFQEAGALSAVYNDSTRVLTVEYVPDETTVGQLAALINKGTIPAADIADGQIDEVEAPAAGQPAQWVGTYAGHENDFTITATETDKDFTIRFAYVADVEPTITWLSGDRDLIIEFQPGVTTVQSIVNAINDAGIPLTAAMTVETVVAGATPGGTGTFSEFDLTQQLSVTSGTPLSTGTISMHGYDNDFVVATTSGTIANFNVEFASGSSAGANWDGTTLTLTYDPGITTAAQLVATIKEPGVPFVADLVSDLPMLVKFQPVVDEFGEPVDNDGTGTITSGDLLLTPDYKTQDGSSTQKAATIDITPEGDDNDFKIVARDTGTAYNGKRVNFYELDDSETENVKVTWAGNTLTIQYKPNDATIQDIQAKVDAVPLCPLEVVVIETELGDTGLGTIDFGKLATGPAYMTDGGNNAVPATTGIINPTGINNAIEIYAVDNSDAHNGLIVAFYEHDTRASAIWNGADTLSVTYVADKTEADEIVVRINNSGGPLRARLLPDLNVGEGKLGIDGSDENEVIHHEAAFLIDGAYERIFTNTIIDTGSVNHEFFVPEDAKPGDAYARFRVTSTGTNADGELIGPGGLALDGEVEDHMVNIRGLDYGDAPLRDGEDTYQTTLTRGILPGDPTSDGARHVIDGPWLGGLLAPGQSKAEFVDYDINGMPHIAAEGDDSETDPDQEAYDDEGGVTFGPAGFVPGEDATIDVSMHREDFDGRASRVIDPPFTDIDTFIVRAADYGDTLNGTEIYFEQVAALPNDATGTIPASAVQDGREDLAENGDGRPDPVGWPATTVQIDPDGSNNAFVVRTVENDYDSYTVRYNHLTAPDGPASASWDEDTGTLTIGFIPDTTTLQELAATINTGSLPASSLPNGHVIDAVDPDDQMTGDHATTGTIAVEGFNNNFRVDATDEIDADGNFQIQFTHGTSADPVVLWDDTNRILEVEFLPGVTTAEQLVDAIDAAADPPLNVPLDASLVLETATIGTGAIPSTGFPNGHAIPAAAGAAGTFATTGTIAPIGYDNDFAVTATDLTDAAGNFTLQFIYSADPDPQVLNWNAISRTLLVTFLPGTTTSGQLVDAINAAAADPDTPIPFSANLVSNTPAGSGTGAVKMAVTPLGSPIPVAAASETDYATTGVLSSDGYDNDIILTAETIGLAGSFNLEIRHGDDSPASWDSDTNTLTVTFLAGVTPAAELVEAINTSGVPFRADVVGDLPLVFEPIDDTNALPIANYDPTHGRLTVEYNVGTTTAQIVDAIDSTDLFMAEHPGNDGSSDVSNTGLDGYGGDPYDPVTLAGGQWPGILDAWIDFNRDGSFDDSEHVIVGQSLYDIQDQVDPEEPLNSFTVYVDPGVTPGETYARFRVTSDGKAADGSDLKATGLAMSGEVEDYRIVIRAVDYGDAPDSYSTKRTSGGARHIVAGPTLGLLADHDSVDHDSIDALGDDNDPVNLGTGVIPASDIADGDTFTASDTVGPFALSGEQNDFRIYRPAGPGAEDFTVLFETGTSADADWDSSINVLTVTFVPDETTAAELKFAVDNEASALFAAELVTEDDEDGIDLTDDALVPGEWASFDVMVSNVTGSAYLKGWIDYDGTGSWEVNDAIQWGDGSTLSGDTFVDMSLIPVNPDGTRTVHFLVPDWAEPGQTYLRFRISSDPDLSFDGSALDGEVEDYVGYIHSVDHGDAAVSYGTAPHIFTLDPTGPWLGDTKPDHDLPVPTGGLNDDINPFNDGSGVIPAGEISTTLPYVHADEITPFALTGLNNDFRIYRTGDLGGAPFIVEFQDGAPAASWDSISNILTVTFQEDTTLVSDLIDLINAEQVNSGSPLEAALVAEPESDDENGVNEDEISFTNSYSTSELIPGELIDVTFTVSNAIGVVYGWIDFNNDGVFDNADEYIVQGVTVDPGVLQSESFTVPFVEKVSETVAARFRVVAQRRCLDSRPHRCGLLR